MTDPVHRPPRWAQRCFERLLAPAYDAVLGDLEEDYHDRVACHGARRAALGYVIDGFRVAPVLLVHAFLWHHIMLKNYVQIAFRNLRKNKSFSAINILGLAVSMSVCLLIIALIRDQKSYDTFHAKADRIYRVTSEVEKPYGRFKMATSPGPLAPALLAEAPGVENAVRFSRFGGNATYGAQTFPMSGLYAEATFFEVFDFVLAQGDPQTALTAPYSLVLTQETAARFFGETDPMGKVIHRDGIGDFTVTGVLKDLPYKSHFQVEGFASFSTLAVLESGSATRDLNNWNEATSHYNYLLLAEGASPDDVEALITDLVARNYTDVPEERPVLRLQALTHINLGPELGNPIGTLMPAESAYILATFALLLILIAVFNYVSLSAARSLKRAREIGIRKVVGAHRGQIVRQFLSEAIIVALLSLALAAVLLVWLLPGFNNLRAFHDDLDIGMVSIDLARDGGLFVLFVGFAVGIGLLAGLYPAFKMSSYVPTRVLKGVTSAGGGGSILRKGLVVFQFSLSIIAVITTMVIYQQFSFLMQAQYGFDEEHLVDITLQGVAYETLRNELMRQPDVVSVAAASDLPAAGDKTWTDIQAEGMEAPILMQFYSIDENFLDQFGLDVVAGRDFSETFSTGQDEEPILVTRKALPTLGIETPEEAVGKVVSLETFPGPHTAVIIGVVEDLYARGYEKGYVPVIFRHLPERFAFAVVRVRPDRPGFLGDELSGTIAGLQAVWKQLAPTLTFDYAFYDEQLAQRYGFFQDMIKFFGVLAGFIIFIACLGLLGMASYSAETRTKEVGIRKVLGADVRSVVTLLSSDYVKLLLLAVLIAVPAAWLLTSMILQTFANRVVLSVWIFVAGTLPVLLLALFTVGSQTVKAGLTNPVDTLRHE